MEWSRQREADLVSQCLQVAGCAIAPASRDDADVCRLSAQLVKTRHPEASRNLTAAADAYFLAHGGTPRPFTEVVEAGLMTDLPRLRNLIENALAGVRSW
jgi:hypothetical protein